MYTIPKTIKTNERIFKITTFEGDTYLCNLEHLKLEDLELIKRVWHMWNFKFESFDKRQLKSMLISK